MVTFNELQNGKNYIKEATEKAHNLYNAKNTDEILEKRYNELYKTNLLEKKMQLILKKNHQCKKL